MNHTYMDADLYRVPCNAMTRPSSTSMVAFDGILLLLQRCVHVAYPRGSLREQKGAGSALKWQDKLLLGVARGLLG